ncbi:hypothetical protein GQ53DRAFT_371125 [Thozetella sp. PMI_491]|nr:hypothetical protein GQ53DRAFT_371125 [Thozetella sp. PMI_491]
MRTAIGQRWGREAAERGSLHPVLLSPPRATLCLQVLVRPAPVCDRVADTHLLTWLNPSSAIRTMMGRRRSAWQPPRGGVLSSAKVVPSLVSSTREDISATRCEQGHPYLLQPVPSRLVPSGFALRGIARLHDCQSRGSQETERERGTGQPLTSPQNPLPLPSAGCPPARHY